MALWINRTVLTGSSVDQNGTNSHTSTFASATSGNYLVAIVSGAVTFTTPSGWTLLNSAVNESALYIFVKTASASESSFTTTHNGSNYAIRGVVYEFGAGTLALTSGAATGVGGVAVTTPAIAGLTGSYTAFSVRAHALSQAISTFSTTWTTPSITDYNEYVPAAGTDGIGLAIAYDDELTGSSFAPNYDASWSNAASTGEGITFALSVSAIPIPDPIAAYGFNEISGTTTSDDTANNHDLAVNSASNFDTGHTGNGLHQVGGGAPHQITNPATWFSVPERTIMFWGKRDSEGANSSSRTVYQLDGSNVTFGISISDGTNAAFTVRQNNTEVTLTTSEVTLGTWAHYALTYDQETVRAYIDGVEVASQAAAGTIDTSDDNLYFYGQDYQQHTIDDLRLFNAALSGIQITTYMNDPIEGPDAIAPSVPQNLSVNATDQEVTIDWDDATDNIAVQDYVVYRSASPGFTPVLGDQVGSPTSSSYTETAPVATWYYRVSARDEAGNESAPSNEISVTTTASPNYFFPSALGWALGTSYIDDTNAGLNAGLTFAVTSASQIAGARFYSPKAQTNLTITLYENEIEVAQKTNASVSTGWNFIPFDTPYLAQSGIDYCVSIFLPPPFQSFTIDEAADWAGASVGTVYTTLPGSGRFDLNPTEQYPINSSTRWFGIDAVVLARSGKVKVWDGGTWVAHPIKVWDGSAWITRKAKGFDGSTFIEGKE